jgi:hypothetical protein
MLNVDIQNVLSTYIIEKSQRKIVIDDKYLKHPSHIHGKLS